MIRASSVLMMFVTAAGASIAATGGDVNGSVFELTSSSQVFHPIKGAKVSLVEVFSGKTIATALSDAGGAFEFHAIPDGSYGVEATDKTRCAISRVFHVSEGSSSNVRLQLRNDDLCSNPVSFASPRN